MKKFKYACVLAIVAFFISGCAVYNQTTFSDFHGPSEFVGRGGIVKNVKGIDIWTNGEPNRKFKILGIIEHSHQSTKSVVSYVAGMVGESELIASAKEHGGDAIIMLSENSTITGYKTRIDATGQTSGNYGNGAYNAHTEVDAVARTYAETRTDKRVAVIKYLD